jgi:hypothetical protein
LTSTWQFNFNVKKPIRMRKTGSITARLGDTTKIIGRTKKNLPRRGAKRTEAARTTVEAKKRVVSEPAFSFHLHGSTRRGGLDP